MGESPVLTPDQRSAITALFAQLDQMRDSLITSPTKNALADYVSLFQAVMLKMPLTVDQAAVDIAREQARKALNSPSGSPAAHNQPLPELPPTHPLYIKDPYDFLPLKIAFSWYNHDASFETGLFKRATPPLALMDPMYEVAACYYNLGCLMAAEERHDYKFTIATCCQAAYVFQSLVLQMVRNPNQP